MRKGLFAAGATLALVIIIAFAAGLFAQTPPADVDNPSGVQFTASADHANIDSYELDFLRPDGSVLQTLNLGKPAPVAGTITANINVMPIAFGNGYSSRVRAKAGTAVSSYAVSANKFNRVPGPPSGVIHK